MVFQKQNFTWKQLKDVLMKKFKLNSKLIKYETVLILRGYLSFLLL